MSKEIAFKTSETLLKFNLKFAVINHGLVNYPIFPGLFLEHTNLTRAIISIPALRKGIRLRLKHKVFWKLRPYH